MTEVWQVDVAIISVLAFLGLYLARKYPAVRASIPFLTWIAKIVRETVIHWKLKNQYKNIAEITHNYTVVLDVMLLQKDADNSKRQFALIISEICSRLSIPKKDPEMATRIANAIYVLLNQHKELLETLESLNDIKTLDVKKATLLAVDFLGELVNIEDRLERIFYQDIIYGINRVLLRLKNNPLNKETVADTSATLWRMYQLLLAFKEVKSLGSLSEAEFKLKIRDVLTNSFLASFSGK